MNTKTTMTMVIALVAMISMTGLGSAVTTDVIYTGDGSYSMDFSGDGTGYCGVHTYTDNGQDHAYTTWENTIAFGWQTMDTSSYYDTTSSSGNYGYWNQYGYAHDYEESGSMTDISRCITVGGANDGADASGAIQTYTTDDNGNSVSSLAVYRDDIAWTSHVTTTQDVTIYQNQYEGSDDNSWWWGIFNDHSEYSGSATGVDADINIAGFAYGADTLAYGQVRTESGDAYTYAIVNMTQGSFDLTVESIAESSEYEESGYSTFLWYPYNHYVYSTTDSTTYDEFEVVGNGIGVFVLGAGVDEFAIDVDMTDDNGDFHVYIDAYSGVTQIITPFDGGFDATGYMYAIDLPTQP